VLEFKGRGNPEEADEDVEVAAVAEDGGVCGASSGVLVLVVVSEENGISVEGVPPGLSLVTVTQSVMDTVLLLASAIRCSSGQELVW
jgi:hypothetical protein